MQKTELKMEHECGRNEAKQQDSPEILGVEAGNSRLEDKTERETHSVGLLTLAKHRNREERWNHSNPKPET